MLTGFERRAHGSCEMIPDAFFIFAFKSFLQALPRASAREERLAYMEGQIVVVRVEEPCRHVVTAPMLSLHAYRVENVETDQLHLILLRVGFFLAFHFSNGDLRQSGHAEDLAGAHVLE